MIKISSVDICPYCNQGRIVKVNTKKSNEIIYICEECDTVWGNYDDIFTKKGRVAMISIADVTGTILSISTIYRIVYIYLIDYFLLKRKLRIVFKR